jgi:uncharacterized SAM-binding protein YcdF (DUF218 family)
LSPAAKGARVVAVLGYSNGPKGELHAIGAARLRRAEREARDHDVVLLSGWARGRRNPSEAELMARSWRGRPARIVVDRGARSTLGNVAAAAATARSVEATEVVLVTSSWHGPRAAALLRAALRGSSSTVSLALTDEPAPLRASLREAVCWLGLPLQRPLARLSRRRTALVGWSAR